MNARTSFYFYLIYVAGNVLDFGRSILKLPKTVIITGANSGIGFSACKELAATNQWNVIMACRSLAKGNEALKQISEKAGRSNVIVMELDLASLNGVRSFAERISTTYKNIDVLACNAGIQLTASNKNVQRTVDGFESTIGINHLGHFLLLRLLQKSIKSRVVLVGSGVHNPAEAGGNVGSAATLGDLRGLELGFKAPIAMIDGGEYDGDKAYKDSKLCNVITALELSRRLKQSNSKVTCNVMNPGLIPTTGLFRNLNPVFVFLFTLATRFVFKVATTEEEGGRRLAYLISSPDLHQVTGKYFSGKPGRPEFLPYEVSKEAQDLEVARKLWDFSSKIVEAGRGNK